MKKLLLLLALTAGVIVFVCGCGDDSVEKVEETKETKERPAHILTESQLEELLKTKSAEQIFEEDLVNKKAKKFKERYCIDTDGLRLLLKNGLDVNAEGSKGERSLHIAAFWGDLDLVKDLINKNADVNAETVRDSSTVLHYAAERGYLEIVKYLVEEKGLEVNLNEKKKSSFLLYRGVSVLHSAARGGNLDVVKYLVEEKGADVNAHSGVSVLNHAAIGGNLDVVKYLIEKGAKINAYSGITVLHVAAYHGNLEVVKYLVEEKRVRTFITDGNGETALHYAAKNGNFDVVKYFVEKGLDVNKRKKHGFSVLHYAAKNGNFDMVRYLVEKGADVNALSRVTVLHYAALGGNLDVVKYLVEKGADVNFESVHGATAFAWAKKPEIKDYLRSQMGDRVKALFFRAVLDGRLDRVKKYVNNGADVNAKLPSNATALYYAAGDGNLEIVKYLVEEGADVNAKDNKGITALHLAAAGGHLEIVKCLVENGADVNAKDMNNLTALHFTAERGNHDMVKYLVEKGANVNARDNEGRNALYFTVAKNRDINVVKCLVENGADVNVKFGAHNAVDDELNYLAKKESNGNANKKYGETVLHIAAYHGNFDMVRYLVENGANINAKDNEGRSAFIWARTQEIKDYLRSQME